MRTALSVPVVLSLLLLPGRPLAQLPPIPLLAEVMVVGTYHMAASSDFLPSMADDVLTPRRQAELEELVSRLAAFQPTRIVLEVARERDSLLNQNYRDYLAGARPLGRGEEEQIGFRLAARLGHTRVHAVDYRLHEDIAGVMAYAARAGELEHLALMGAAMEAITADAARRAPLPIPEILLELNAPRTDSLEALYLLLAPLGAGDGHPGAELVARRMERNLKIFANIAQLAEPGDRILVLYGSSHGKLLRQFFAESPAFSLVHLEAYLRPPALPGR